LNISYHLRHSISIFCHYQTPIASSFTLCTNSIHINTPKLRKCHQQPSSSSSPSS
jgi:hypothetical protein